LHLNFRYWECIKNYCRTHELILQFSKVPDVVPDDLPFGQHILEIKCDCGGQNLLTRQQFIKGHIDNFDKQ
jgi:hypothetical protein